MDGAGGQKAANYVHKTARPDGLTIGFWSAGAVPAAVLGQMGVLYDLKEAIFLGAHQTGRSTTFFTRKELGLDNLEKLRAASGLRVGAQAVGHGGYYVARLFAYVFGLKEPKWVTGYNGPESDIAITTGEIDSRASAIDQILASRLDWVDKGLMHFHAIYECPKVSTILMRDLLNSPTFAFCQSRESARSRSLPLTQSASPRCASAQTPKQIVQTLRDALAKVFDDPQFYKDYEKLTGEEPRPLTGDLLEREIRDIGGQQDIAELLKKIGGPDTLPARQ